MTRLTTQILFFAVFLAMEPAQAGVFQNAYLRFQLPDHWACENERTDWICHPKDPIRRREAIVILTAKEAGPEDRIDSFKAYLGRPRTIRSRVGTPVPSKVLGVQDLNIRGQRWIGGIHMSSEVEDFQTRYLATTKGPLAVLISLSAHKDKVKGYERDFETMMSSLQLIANPQISQEVAGAGSAGSEIPTVAAEQVPAQVDSSIRWQDPMTMALSGALILVLGALGYALLKK